MRIAGVGLTMAAVATHLGLVLDGTRMEVAGPRLVLDHVFTIAATAALLSVCTAVGRTCLLRFGLFEAHTIDALAYSTAFGMGVLATAILALGYTLGFSPIKLWLLIATCAAMAYRQVGLLPDLLTGALRELAAGISISRLLFVPSYLLFLAVAAFVFLMALAPSVDFDTLMYHLRLPSQWLEHGAPYLPEDNMHAALLGLVHMLYLPLLALGAPASPAVLSAILLLLLGLTVYSICRQLFGAAAGALGMSLLWGNAAILLVAISPKVDVTVALFLLMAYFALHMAGRWGAAPAHAFGLSGALLGFGFGAKYLALPYGLAMLPTLALAARRVGSGWRVYLKLLAIFLLAAAVAALPWVLKNVALFGAPLYPFLTPRQLEPWLQDLYHTRYLPDWIQAESLEVLRSVRAPFNLRDFLLAPSRLTPEFDAAFFLPSPAVILAPLALLVRNRTAITFALTGVLFVVGVLAVSREINLRYLIPALPLLTIATAGALGSGSARPAKTRALALLALIALCLPAAVSASWFRIDRTRAIALGSGRISRVDYLWGNPRMFEMSYLKMVSRVNNQISNDSKVLMLFEARGYYLEVPVIQDNVFVNWSLLAPVAPSTDCLKTTHITHVLVNTEILRFLIYRGLRSEVINWAAFKDFAERCLERVHEGPDYELYRVRDRQ